MEVSVLLRKGMAWPPANSSVALNAVNVRLPAGQAVQNQGGGFAGYEMVLTAISVMSVQRVLNHILYASLRSRLRATGKTLRHGPRTFCDIMPSE